MKTKIFGLAVNFDFTAGCLSNIQWTSKLILKNNLEANSKSLATTTGAAEKLRTDRKYPSNICTDLRTNALLL